MKRLLSGPCTVKHFADLWNSRQASRYHLRKFAEAGKANVVGDIAWMDGGRLLVFAGAGVIVRRNQLLHDAMAHLAALKMNLPYKLVPRTDAELEPDITWIAGTGENIHGELCTGSSSYPVIEKRFEDYASCTDPVLWIVSGWWGTAEQTRLKKLRELAASTSMRDIAWFGTLTDVLSNGRAATFLSCDGRQTSMAEVLMDFGGATKTEIAGRAEENPQNVP